MSVIITRIINTKTIKTHQLHLVYFHRCNMARLCSLSCCLVVLLSCCLYKVISPLIGTCNNSLIFSVEYSSPKRYINFAIADSVVMS